MRQYDAPKAYTARYLETRERVNAPTLETSRPGIFHHKDPGQWHAANELLRTFPEMRHLKPWASEDPMEIRREAIERGILIDKFEGILEDTAKRKRPADHFKTSPDLLKRYVGVHDRPQFQTTIYFPWNTEGAFVIAGDKRTTQETIYNSIIQDDPKLFTPDDFKKAQTKKIRIGGMGVGSSCGDIAVELGFPDVGVIDKGLVTLHDFARQPSAGFPRIEKNHAEHWAHGAYEKYPYGNFSYIKQYLGDGTNGTYPRREFLQGADLYIEVVDNPMEKFLSREAAAELGVPVVMTTDVEFGSIVTWQEGRRDVTIFPRLQGEDRHKIVSGEDMPFVEKSQLANNLVGPRADYWTKGAHDGRSNWSQNGVQAAASKVALGYTLRRWLRGEPIPGEKEIAIYDKY